MSEKISSLYFGLLFGALVLIGLSLVQVDVFTNYGLDSPDLSYLSATEDVINQTSNLEESVKNTVITGIVPLDQFIASTFGTVKLLFGIVNIYDSFVSDTSAILGVPQEFSILVTIIMVIITLTVIFGIIRIVTHESV